MKKFFKSIPFIAIMSISAMTVAATLISKDDVNKKVAGIIASFNTANSSMEITFTDLNIDAVRTLDFGARAAAWKLGSENEIKFAINKADYHFGDGTAPEVSLDLSAKLDIVKLVGQEQINEMAQELDKMALDMATEYTQKYGAAITIDSKIDDLQKDSKGNVVSVKMHFSGQMDFSKLPATLPVSEVEFKTFNLAFTISRTDISAMGTMILNPQNKGFAQDQVGLKELIEKLLSEDAETFNQIADFAGFIDTMTTTIVERKAQPAIQ